MEQTNFQSRPKPRWYMLQILIQFFGRTWNKTGTLGRREERSCQCMRKTTYPIKFVINVSFHWKSYLSILSTPYIVTCRLSCRIYRFLKCPTKPDLTKNYNEEFVQQFRVQRNLFIVRQTIRHCNYLSRSIFKFLNLAVCRLLCAVQSRVQIPGIRCLCASEWPKKVHWSYRSSAPALF